jgi:hypothetical protein
MKYTCKCCKYNTINKNDYTKHLSTLKHINNFKTNKYCDLCDKEYSTIAYFKIHYKREHLNNNESCDDNNKIHDKNINKTNNINITKNTHTNDNISYNTIDAIKNIIDESNDDVKQEINKSNKEVVAVVHKAITKASELIKYLMIHHSETPPLKKITQTNCSKLLKLNYNCSNKTEIEKDLLYDYVKKYFVRNISKSILSYVNHKKPELQPIWNTDCARNHYVIKTADNWNEDKAGVKFTDYIIKPLLLHIKDIISKYHEKISKVDQKTGKTSDEILEYMTKLYNCLSFVTDLSNDVFVQPILKELSPYLRYLSSELNLDEDDDDDINADDEDIDNNDNSISDKSDKSDKNSDDKIEKLEELKLIQKDLINIVKNTHSDSDSNSEDEDNHVSVYRLKSGKVLTIKH